MGQPRKRKPKPPPPRPTQAGNGSDNSAELFNDRWRPWLLAAMCALFVARPLFPSESAVSGDGLFLVMLWLALAVLWFLGTMDRNRFAVRFGPTEVAVVLFLLLHTLAALWATGHASPRPAVNMLWEWIALGISFLLARQLVRPGRESRAVLGMMLALAVGLSTYGLFQGLYELPATQAEYRADPDAMLREAGLWLEPGSRERALFEKRLESREPLATFALTNSLAGYLGPWLVVAIGIGASASMRRRGWIAAGILVLPLVGCLILTKSRSAYAATLFGLGLVCLGGLWSKRRIGWKAPLGFALLVALLIAAAIVSGGLDTKVFSEASKSLGYRVQYWQSTLDLIQDHPIGGCGPGNFQRAYTRYMLPEASEEIADPHNFLLEIWATAGTPTLLAFLGVLGTLAAAAFPRRGPPQGVSKRPTDQASEQPRDATAYVFAGAACGFPLALWVGSLGTAPPGLVASILGFPPAVIAVVLLWRWIDTGNLPAGLPWIAGAVLLVNLLAAGGIGFPGVAGTFWLLAAVGLGESRGGPRHWPRGAGFAGLAILILAVIACSTTAFGPVLRCRQELAFAEREPGRAVEHLEAAAAADPLAVEPLQVLARHSQIWWTQNPTPEGYAAFSHYVKEAERVAPNSAVTCRAAGDLYREAFRRTGQREALREAVLYYQRAVEHYPNSGSTRADLALALFEAGKLDAFAHHAKVALRLDRLTPHSDKKLDDSVRDALVRGLRRGRSQESGLQAK